MRMDKIQCKYHCKLTVILILLQVEVCFTNDWSQLLSSFSQTDTHITVTGKQASSVPTSTFSPYTKLTYLDIQRNGIENVSETAFEGTLVEELKLSYNKLSTFPNLGTVASTLKRLWLRDNLLVDVNCLLLEVLTSLEFIELQNNQLSIVPGTCSATIQLPLKEMVLSTNPLTHVSIFSFNGMGALETLYLSTTTFLDNMNQVIRRLPSSLKYLDFEKSELENSHVEALVNKSDLYNLENLRVSVNKFTSIPVLHPNSSKSVITIRATDCQITHIQQYMLDNYPNLNQLFLDNNKITGIPDLLSPLVPSQPYFKMMSVRINQIANVSDNAFRGLCGLVTLYLTQNSIRTFPNFNHCLSDTLTILDMYYNPIVNVEVNSGSMFTKLRQLSLGGLGSDMPFIPDLTGSINTLNTFQYIGRLDERSQNVLSRHTALRYVYLTGGPITVFPDVSSSKHTLKEVEVTNTDINYLHPDTFNNFNALYRIKFLDGNLTHFPKITNSPITDLHLSDIPLVTLPDLDGIKTTLQKLEIDGTEISSIQDSEILYLDKLANLKLEDNTFNYIANLSKLQSLSVLYMSNVQVVCDCFLAWLKDGSLAAQVYIDNAPQKCTEPAEMSGLSWSGITEEMLLNYCPNDTMTSTVIEDVTSTVAIQTTSQITTNDVIPSTSQSLSTTSLYTTLDVQTTTQSPTTNMIQTTSESATSKSTIDDIQTPTTIMLQITSQSTAPEKQTTTQSPAINAIQITSQSTTAKIETTTPSPTTDDLQTTSEFAKSQSTATEIETTTSTSNVIQITNHFSTVYTMDDIQQTTSETISNETFAGSDLQTVMFSSNPTDSDSGIATATTSNASNSSHPINRTSTNTPLSTVNNSITEGVRQPQKVILIVSSNLSTFLSRGDISLVRGAELELYITSLSIKPAVYYNTPVEAPYAVLVGSIQLIFLVLEIALVISADLSEAAIKPERVFLFVWLWKVGVKPLKRPDKHLGKKRRQRHKHRHRTVHSELLQITDV